MADFRFTSESFASTEVMVEPVTEAGERMFAEFFGNACNVTLRKSGGLEFSEVAAERGLVCAYLTKRRGSRPGHIKPPSRARQAHNDHDESPHHV